MSTSASVANCPNAWRPNHRTADGMFVAQAVGRFAGGSLEFYCTICDSPLKVTTTVEGPKW